MRPAFRSRTNKRPTTVLPPDAGLDSETWSSAIAVSFHSFRFIHFTVAVQSRDSTSLGHSMLRLAGRPHESSLVSRTPRSRCRGLLRSRGFLDQRCQLAREKAATSWARERTMSWLAGSSMLLIAPASSREDLAALKPQSGRSLGWGGLQWCGATTFGT